MAHLHDWRASDDFDALGCACGASVGMADVLDACPKGTETSSEFFMVMADYVAANGPVQRVVRFRRRRWADDTDRRYR